MLLLLSCTSSNLTVSINTKVSWRTSSSKPQVLLGVLCVQWFIPAKMMKMRHDNQWARDSVMDTQGILNMGRKCWVVLMPQSYCGTNRWIKLMLALLCHKRQSVTAFCLWRKPTERLCDALGHVSLGNCGSGHSCGCHKYHLPKHCCRPNTPLHGQYFLKSVASFSRTNHSVALYWEFRNGLTGSQWAHNSAESASKKSIVCGLCWTNKLDPRRPFLTIYRT